MHTADEAKSFATMREKIRANIDKEWRELGATSEELETSRRLSKLFVCELDAGRIAFEIEAEWEGKTPEEILNAAEQTE
jgi:hypothetical protein